jgi:hypothetical protein
LTTPRRFPPPWTIEKAKKEDGSAESLCHGNLAGTQEDRMATRRWRINGYVGLKPLMEDTLGFNAFSEEGMIALLQRLVCKHLEIHEIINASLKEHSAGYGPELKPNNDRSGKLTISVGTNPHYVATILEPHESD